MKVLLYTEGLKVIGVSGLGKAIKHQMKALELENIHYISIIGSEEITSGKLRVKNMLTKEEITIETKNLNDYLKNN